MLRKQLSISSPLERAAFQEVLQQLGDSIARSTQENRRMGYALDLIRALMDPSSVPTDTYSLKQVIQKCAEGIGVWQNRDVTVEVECMDTQSRVPQLLLIKTLINLLSNAFKFADKSIKVHIKIEGGTLQIEVENDGTPIPKRFREKIGQEAIQSAEGMSKGGSGVGLSKLGYTLRAVGGNLLLDPTESPTIFRALLPLDAIMPQAETDDDFKSQVHDIRAMLSGLSLFLSKHATENDHLFVQKVSETRDALTLMLDFSQLPNGLIPPSNTHLDLDVLFQELQTALPGITLNRTGMTERVTQLNDNWVKSLLIQMIRSFTEQGATTLALTSTTHPFGLQIFGIPPKKTRTLPNLAQLREKFCEELASKLGGNVEHTTNPAKEESSSLLVTFTEARETKETASTSADLSAAVSQRPSAQISVGNSPALSPDMIPFKVHASADTLQKPPAIQKKDVKIVIVDDSPANLKILTTLLRKAGYTASISTFVDPNELLKAPMDWSQVHIVISDQEMPDYGMTGCEVIKALTKSSSQKFPGLAVLCTADAKDPTVQKMAAESGAAATMDKKFPLLIKTLPALMAQATGIDII